MLVKPNVDISRLRRPCRRALQRIDEEYKDFVLTSTCENASGRRADSLHYADLAFDIGKITFFQVPIKRKRLVEIAGVGFDVVEYKTYFHLEYDPK